MLNISLKEALKQKLEQRGKMTRRELRRYGETLSTIRNPYGYDVATADRRLRELAEAGVITPLDRNGMPVIHSDYTTHYLHVNH